MSKIKNVEKKVWFIYFYPFIDLFKKKSKKGCKDLGYSLDS